MDSLLNWVELDLKVEPIERATMGETSLACPPSYHFLGLGDDDCRDYIFLCDSGNIRPPPGAFIHRIWPIRVKFFQCSSGKRLKCLVETKCALYHCGQNFFCGRYYTGNLRAENIKKVFDIILSNDL